MLRNWLKESDEYEQVEARTDVVQLTHLRHECCTVHSYATIGRCELYEGHFLSNSLL